MLSALEMRLPLLPLALPFKVSYFHLQRPLSIRTATQLQQALLHGNKQYSLTVYNCNIPPLAITTAEYNVIKPDPSTACWSFTTEDEQSCIE